MDLSFKSYSVHTTSQLVASISKDLRTILLACSIMGNRSSNFKPFEVEDDCYEKATGASSC